MKSYYIGPQDLRLGDDQHDIEIEGGDNRIIGGHGDNSILTGDGVDRISLGDGDNLVEAGDGENRIALGSGWNAVIAGVGRDRIVVGDGVNFIRSGGGDDMVRAGNGDNQLETGEGDDHIRFGDGDNVVQAGHGDNRVYGGDGDNHVASGDGDDRIRLGDGDNEVWSGGGDNRIVVGDGANVIETGAGADRITAGSGYNVIRAGDGDNRIITGAGDALILTGNGADIIRAGGATNEIDAGNGDNRIVGGDGVYLIATGDGDDVIRLGDVDATLTDAGGDNLVRLAGGEAEITLGGGDDTVNAGAASGRINAGGGDNRISAGDGSLVVETRDGRDMIRLGDGDNRVNSGDGGDRVRVGDGDNEVTTGVGADQIVAGNGRNAISAGGGNDVIRSGDGGSSIDAGAGDDRVRSGAGDDSVDGGDGNDTIDSGAGDDTVRGGQGDDILRGGDGYDVAVYAGSSVDYALTVTSRIVTATSLSSHVPDAGTDRLYGVEAIFFEGDGVLLDLGGDRRPALVADSLVFESEDPQSFLLSALLANDRNIGASSSAFEVSAVSEKGLSISFDGATVTYNEADALQHLGEGERFEDRFSYIYTDTIGARLEAIVTVTVIGQNDAPQAGDDRLSRFETYFAEDYEPAAIDVLVTSLVSGEHSVSTSLLKDGSYVVVWNANGGGDPSGTGVRAQIFSAEGAALSPNMLVNQSTAGIQQHADVATLSDGRFVVTWSSTAREDPGENTINARIYAADGTPLTAELSVDNVNSNREQDPNVAALANGGYVVSWSERDAASLDWNVRAAIFDGEGVKVVDDFFLNRERGALQQMAEVTALADGGFVATWYSHDGADGSSAGVKARVFDSAGRVVVDEFLVNQTTQGLQINPTIAARPDGGFAVVWFTQDDGFDYRARIFNADGTEAAPEFLVNTADLKLAGDAPVMWLPDGRLLISWMQFPEEDRRLANGEIRARIFEPDGTPFGEEFVVSEGKAQGLPDIVALEDGRFILTWASDVNVDGKIDLYSRLYDPTSTSGVREAPLTNEEAAIEFLASDLLANDVDVDGDTLMFALDGLVSERGARIAYDAATGLILYDPTSSAEIQALNNGERVEDRFTYSVSDGHGGTDQGAVVILVGGIDEPFS